MLPAMTLALLAAMSVAGEPPPPAVPDDIIVTATQRPGSAADVPATVHGVDAVQLRDSGASDIRQLNQLVPSLLVSSSSNEAGGAGARIRGIGTVGDNAGLESSVATYVDGVYRSRAAVALTELGPVARIDVLDGPQGTLFGRNASAGLISITTAAPSFTSSGYGEAQLGNYAARQFGAGLTGPLVPGLAFRIDGLFTRRDGFIEDVVSGRCINGRHRWLARGKLLYQPDASFSATLTLDHARRDEECCAGVYLPASDLRSTTPGVGGGMVIAGPSSIAALIRSTPSAVPGGGGIVLDADPYARKVALTPGQSFRQDVRDGGAALALDKDLGWARLSSVTAWRDNRFIKGQDADFSSLDLIQRPSDGSGFIRFRTFSQEARLRGKGWGDRLDWLIGGYVSDERLTLQDNMRYGLDYDRFASARIGALGGAFAGFPSYGFANLSGFARAYGGDALAAQVQDVPLGGTGELDRFRQHDGNQALFTHDIVHLTSRLALTIGARYTRDAKRLDANLASTSGCAIYVADIQRLRALAGAPGTTAATASLAGSLANNVLAPLTGYPCNINSVNGAIGQRRVEHRWTGTAALEWTMRPGLNAYASWSRGYKAGGFNLDRAALFNTGTRSALPAASLAFDPETVDAIELGAKVHRPLFDLDVALFSERFRNFQLNSYTGTNFIVSNIQGCTAALGQRDSDAVAGNSACTDTTAGVTSRGVELNAALRPVRDVSLAAGLTYADTRYARDIVGSPDPLTGNNSLAPVLFLLPGSRLSNAPAYVAVGSARWTPPVGGSLRALAYADLRYQSAINTGSDLLTEKGEGAVVLVNARIGLGRGDGRWSVEFWAQNLFDRKYEQVAFSEPLQGGGSGGLPGTAAAVARFGTTSSQLFGAFLGEPRTWGATLRRQF